ncbi:MAG: glycosyltransferase family 2 protein [Pirellulales bacterium]
MTRPLTSESGGKMPPVQAQRVFVVLPAYNEEQALPPLLTAIQAALDPAGIAYCVIVVDDGSRDATADVARKAAERLPVELVLHAKNQGLAAAIRTGLTAALARCGANDVIVTMDCDDTHPPRLIPEMLAKIGVGLDVVIASRFQPGAAVIGVPRSRQLYSVAARWLFQLLFPIPGVRDYTCGFRVYRADALRRAVERYGDGLISETGFSCMADLLLKLRSLSLAMGEVPLELRYDRRGGGSKMRVLRTIRQTLGLLLRRRFGLR